MKKSLFYVALGAMVLTSCAQDEVLDTPKNAVQFSVATENAGRGSVITTGNIDQFCVTAFMTETTELPNGESVTTPSKFFMDDVLVNKTDNGAWDYDVLKFWPNSGKIDFYSYAPVNDIVVAKFEKAGQTIDYTVPRNCADQLDVLYAYNQGLTKTANAVPVNFRHALSQVVFKAKNTKADLTVQVNGIRIVGLYDKGTLTMPAESTTVQAAEDENGKFSATGPTWGTWAVDETQAKVDYTAALAEGDLVLESSSYFMSDEANPLLLMPQTLAPATIAGNKMNFDGAYFAVSCKIVSTEEKTGEEIQVWPAAAGEFAEVNIPVNSPDRVKNTDGSYTYFWQQGRRYVYSFVFGEGAGYDANGDPVLVPVTFEVTVDSFQNDVKPVDLNTGNPENHN